MGARHKLKKGEQVLVNGGIVVTCLSDMAVVDVQAPADKKIRRHNPGKKSLTTKPATG